MNEVEIKRIISETVSQTVAETLLKLGVDTSDPIELQSDFAHLRKQRVAFETVKRQSLMAAVGVLTLSMLGLIWNAIKGS